MRRKSQAYRWIVAAIAILVAVALGVRRTANVIEPIDDSNFVTSGLIASTMDALKRDPRLRNETTRKYVSDTASLIRRENLDRPEPYLALGLLYLYAETDPVRAEEAFRAAIALNSDWEWPYSSLGVALYKQDKHDDATAAWEHAKLLAPNWVAPYNERAILLRRDGDLSGARAELEAALTIDPHDPITRYNYGVYWDVTGNRLRAREEYERVIQVEPDMAAAHYNLACSYARERNVNIAASHLAEAIRLNDAFAGDVERDPDFDPVRGMPAFDRVLGIAR